MRITYLVKRGYIGLNLHLNFTEGIGRAKAVSSRSCYSARFHEAFSLAEFSLYNSAKRVRY